MIPLPAFNSWLEQHTEDIEALCLDIDGVLLKGGRKLPGSRRLIDMLNQKGLAYVLLTNDGNHSPQEKTDRLNRAGLTAIGPQHIISCGHAIKTQADTLGLAGRQFFVMGDTGTPCYAEAAGLKVTRRLEQLHACQGVIIGEAHYDWESVINAVVNYYIGNGQAPLIVPNPDEFYPAAESKIHIAAGGVARLIQRALKEYGMDINPIYLGKPYPPIFQLAHQRLEQRLASPLSPEKVMMVGDNLSADIAGGQNMGYRTTLLLTGVTIHSAMRRHQVLPDMVFNGLQ